MNLTSALTPRSQYYKENYAVRLAPTIQFKKFQFE